MPDGPVPTPGPGLMALPEGLTGPFKGLSEEIFGTNLDLPGYLGRLSELPKNGLGWLMEITVQSIRLVDEVLEAITKHPVDDKVAIGIVGLLAVAIPVLVQASYKASLRRAKAEEIVTIYGSSGKFKKKR